MKLTFIFEPNFKIFSRILTILEPHLKLTMKDDYK